MPRDRDAEGSKWIAERTGSFSTACLIAAALAAAFALATLRGAAPLPDPA